MALLLTLPKLTFAKFRFTLQALQTLYLPEYKGSTLRGGFGHSFRKVVCTMGPIPCETCLLHVQCPYPQFFETPIVKEPPRFMSGVKTGPQPFVLEPPLETKRVYEKGESLTFTLTLLGRSVEYLPYFIYTFDQLGAMGIGKGKGRFRLHRVEALAQDWQPIYSGETKILSAHDSVMNVALLGSPSEPVHRLTIKFVTPTRIKVGGRLTMEMSFRELVINLLRRVCTLAYFHEPEAEVDWDWSERLKRAKEVESGHHVLEWCDWERYSNRQKTRMKLGGFVGEAAFQGDLTEWLPLLKLGEFVHVGKGATFGLGRFQVVR